MERRRHRKSINEPGHAHELTFSCNGGYPFLKAERTCVWIGEALDAARVKCQFDLWAFVLMPEHVHLIIRPRRAEYQISEILRAIKEPIARKALAWLKDHSPDWLPKLTVHQGQRERRHFWLPGGGYDRNITEPSTLLKMIDYLHLNPVRRGLVERAEEWKWSSAAWFLGLGDSPIPLDRIPPEWLTTG